MKLKKNSNVMLQANLEILKSLLIARLNVNFRDYDGWAVLGIS